MMEAIMGTTMSIVFAALYAWLMYVVVNKLNKDNPELELNPVVHASVAFLFGLTGMCISAGYIAVKSHKVNEKDK